MEAADLWELDFSDDRLGRLLDRYSDDDNWHNFEQSLGKRLLRVYQLEASPSVTESLMHVFRTDSFNLPQFRDVDSLFTYGYSKHRRSDQPFCKVMLSALDPMGIPFAVDILKGGGSDTDHYLGVIDRVGSILGHCGNLHVGDAKLGSVSNRVQIHQSGNYYLCPLGNKQCTSQVLDSYLDQIDHPICELPSLFKDHPNRKTAYFYPLEHTMEDSLSGLQWNERRILVYSPDYGQSLTRSFNNRLEEARGDIEKLVRIKSRGKVKSLKDLHSRVDALVKKYKVQGCFHIHCSENIQKRQIRKYKDRQAREVEEATFTVEIKINDEFIAKQQKRFGWQVYASNVSETLVSTPDLVKCYRDEYRIEHLFDYMINKTVDLIPIYLKKINRVKAIIRLTTIALRFAMMIQYQVREQLRKDQEQIKGIYPGNKNRATPNPTTPMLLRAFRRIAVASIKVGQQYIIEMTPLNQTQEKILELIGDHNIYQRVFHILKKHPNLRET